MIVDPLRSNRLNTYTHRQGSGTVIHYKANDPKPICAPAQHRIKANRAISNNKEEAMQINGASNLTQMLQSLAGQASAAFANDKPFSVTVPTDDGSTISTSPTDATGKETLSGDFHFSMAEPVGDTSLSDPNDPDGSNAATKEFTDAPLKFLSLVNGEGAAGLNGAATYTTSANFSDAGTGDNFVFSGSFKLSPGQPSPSSTT
jgi:hypothetical protein